MRDPEKPKKLSKRERCRQALIIAIPLTLFGLFLYGLVLLLHAALKKLPFDPFLVETISLGLVFAIALGAGAVMLVVLQRTLYPRNKKKND